MKRIALLFLSLIIGGCTTHQEIKPIQIKTKSNCLKIIPVQKVSKIEKDYEVQKIDFLSQNPQDYLGQLDAKEFGANQMEFEKKYFKPWNIKDINSLKLDMTWAFKIYSSKNAYGENLQKIDEDFFKKMKENANFENYLTFNKKAVTLKEVNLRAYPTDKPLLLDPKKTGEGFPFDYLQNSTIAANKPLFVTHYSKDKAWVHVLSSFAYGWVKVKEIALLNDYQTKMWQKAEQIFITKDAVPLYSTDGDFLFESKLGMMLALISETENEYTVLAISNYKSLEARFLKVKLSKDIAHKGIIEFNKKNVYKLLNDLLKSKYGWGGMYYQRDCSSTMRDFYAPFGVWLPRNSFKQSKVGKVVLLDKLSVNKKIATIKEKAIPFQTLLYKSGHIALYVGIQNNKVIIFQNVWGVTTKENGESGRFLVGKTVFSTLELGKNLKYYNKDASFLKKIKSMNILGLNIK